MIGILGIIYLSKAKFSSSNSIKIVDSKVAPFIYGDYVLAAYIDGVESQTIPTKEDGYVVDHVECGTDAVGTWDNSNWTLTISNATKRTKCTVYFKTKPIQYLNNHFS